MCKFFSSITYDGAHLYFDWPKRKAIIARDQNCNGKDMTQFEADSHSCIAAFYGVPVNKCNKYEYNPLTREFIVDQINGEDDSERARRWCESLDFSTIVEPLIIKPIVHPFRITPPKKIAERHLELLRKWDSAWASVRDSVWDSVGASVGDSVRDSVWDSVWDSVRASVRAYISSFYRLPEFDRYKSLVELWEMGLVPSFDGDIWRLHGGKNARVLWEGRVE